MTNPLHKFFPEVVSKTAAEFRAAEARTVAQIGLHASDELVRYPTDPSKVAKAAEVIEQLNRLVGELQSAHDKSAKVAAALAGAVKLAQDGAIDVEDIFDIARQSLNSGTVKTAALDLFLEKEEIGSLVGPSTPAQADLDPLTATLRALRGASR
jgi:hypothetical protein